jgi:hypothetical protein
MIEENLGEVEIKGRNKTTVQEIHQKKTKFDVFFVYIPINVVRELGIRKGEEWTVSVLKGKDSDFIVFKRPKTE